MASNNGVELKGGMYTFMSLKVSTTDPEILDEKLADKVQQAPGFFKNTPVVVDLTGLEDAESAEFDAAAMLSCIRRHQLIPIVASVSDKLSPLATSIELPLIEGGQRGAKIEQPEQTVTSKKSESSVYPESSEVVEYTVKTPMLVTKPIRSGQQVYARDTDLIIMGSVGPGAEVIADHNVHIYGALRGRALCGVSGNTTTRIFCQSLEAELVSVAGNYRMLETIPEELRGKPAQIWLDNDRLNIEPL
ncbi:MAG: septum site-determining protein MinC [Granulosicoccus sp.]